MDGAFITITAVAAAAVAVAAAAAAAATTGSLQILPVSPWTDPGEIQQRP